MTRAVRSRTLRILCLACVLAAAAQADEDAEPHPGGNTTPACLERAVVVAYLHHFQDQVMRRWVLPDDTLADQAVVVRFRLAGDGSLLSWKLRSWTNRRIANSVELAFRHAESAGPIPEPAACLIGRAIEIHFENPY